MSYGYVGATPSQKKPNTGVFTSNDVADLEQDKSWGGGLELIESIAASNDKPTFSNLKVDEYDVHMLTWRGVQITNDNNSLVMLLDTGSGFHTSTEYTYSMEYLFQSGSVARQVSNGAGHHWLNVSCGNQAGERANGIMYLNNLKSGQYARYTQEGSYMNNSGVIGTLFGGGVLDVNTNAVTQIRLQQDSAGDIIQGQFTLYGIKK